MRRLTSVVWLTCTLGFALLAVLSAVAPLSAQEAADRPGLWSGTAGATGLHLDLNTQPTLLPIAEFINVDVPFGQSEWSSGGGEALASPMWPGTAVTEGPSLLCDFGGGCPEAPPSYPFVAKASQTKPEGSTEDGSAHAEVTADHVSTQAGASTALARALEPLAAVFDVDAVHATTDMRFDAGVLVTQARAVLEGVSLVGGTVTIDTIEVVTETRNDGEATVEAAADTTLTGVTVGGQPAAITEEGITIAGQGGGGAEFEEANAQLSSALEQFGADIRLIGAEQSTDGTTTSATAGGLIVSFAAELSGPGLPTAPVPGAPLGVDPNVVYRTYVGSVMLGNVRTSSFASTGGFGLGGDDLSDLGGLSDLAPPASAGSDTDRFDGGGFEAPSLETAPAPQPPTTLADDGQAPAVATPDEPAPMAPQPTRAAAAPAFSQAVADGLSLAYGFAALASAALFLTTRLPGRARASIA